MTSECDRLDRIERLVESNARAIQALADRNAEVTLEIEDLLESQRQASEERAELRRATLGIANLLSSLDSDRPTVMRKLNAIENKVDLLLGRGTGDQPHP